MFDIAMRRLHAQRLVGEPLSSAVDVVRLLGAVQAQDYAGGKWALGQRTAGVLDAEIDRLCDEGRILRTHVMRPTWHFVLPDDIRWLLDLTGPKVHRSLVGRYRQLGIDAHDETRARDALRDALSGRFLTRIELGEVLRAAGISPDGQRLAHLLMAAELHGDIVSGPRRGKQFTYSLLAERAPAARTNDRAEALTELARRYFRSHGPAQIADFVWWSGLTVSDARAGLASAASDLQHWAIDGKEYWFDPNVVLDGPATPVAHLLPNWDEYTVGYRDRDAALPIDQPFDPALYSFGSILSNVVTVAGHVRGSWRRRLDHGKVRIEIRLQATLAPAELAAVELTGHRLGKFLEMPVETAYF